MLHSIRRTPSQLHSLQQIPTQHDMLPQHLVYKNELNREYVITLGRNDETPWWWSEKIETCRSGFNCFKWKLYRCICWLIVEVMLLVLHFLYSHLDFFPEKVRAISSKHGETFHHIISQIEKRYSGKMVSNMLPDYYCSLIWDTPTGECKRQKKTKWVLNEFFSD